MRRGEDRKSTRLNSSHTVIYALSLHDALPILNIEAGFREGLSSLEIRRIVEKELNHISSSPGPQSFLRAMYWVHRVHCLEAGDEEELAHESILMGCVEAKIGRAHV